MTSFTCAPRARARHRYDAAMASMAATISAADASSSTSSSVGATIGNCTAAVAILIAGEARSGLAVWERVQTALVAPNRADVLLHAWESSLAYELRDFFHPCAATFEPYNMTTKLAMQALVPRLKLIREHLYIIDHHETPHVVDYFYIKWRASQLLARVEQHQRSGKQYELVVFVRPDVNFLTSPVRVQLSQPELTVALLKTDHRPDSNDTSHTDPFTRGQCGQTVNDWFAYGTSASMKLFLDGFRHLPELHDTMLATPGYCKWWKCHNFRYRGTFLNNAESFLGFHIRATGLRCVELTEQYAKPGYAVSAKLDTKRVRDWRGAPGNRFNLTSTSVKNHTATVHNGIALRRTTAATKNATMAGHQHRGHQQHGSGSHSAAHSVGPTPTEVELAFDWQRSWSGGSRGRRLGSQVRSPTVAP